MPNRQPVSSANPIMPRQPRQAAQQPMPKTEPERADTTVGRKIKTLVTFRYSE